MQKLFVEVPAMQMELWQEVAAATGCILPFAPKMVSRFTGIDEKIV